MRIDLKRGWNRLILVLAVVWYVGYGYSLWQEHSAFVRDRAAEALKDATAYQDVCNAIANGLRETREPGRKFVPLDATLVDSHGVNIWREIVNNVPDDDVSKLDAAFCSALYKKHSVPSHGPSLWSRVDASLLAIPPCLYLFGLVLGWIVRGFVPQRSYPSTSTKNE
jgi:hypothetical protein